MSEKTKIHPYGDERFGERFGRDEVRELAGRLEKEHPEAIPLLRALVVVDEMTPEVATRLEVLGLLHRGGPTLLARDVLAAVALRDEMEPGAGLPEDLAAMDLSDVEDRQLEPVEVAKSPETCRGCGNEIDSTTCWCGIAVDDHTLASGHGAIPVGCDCHRAGEPTPPLNKIGFVERKESTR